MKTLLTFAALAMAGAAQAHVVLEKKSAEANTYYKAVFMVGHGCTGDAPTTGISVTVPEGVGSVKPQPKPGWTMELRRELDAGGKPGRVAEVMWTGGRLSGDYYDEFAMLVRLPDKAGTLFFPVRQKCESAAADWIEVPAAGKNRRDYKFPAPELEVTAPAKAAPGHRH